MDRDLLDQFPAEFANEAIARANAIVLDQLCALPLTVHILLGVWKKQIEEEEEVDVLVEVTSNF